MSTFDTALSRLKRQHRFTTFIPDYNLYVRLGMMPSPHHMRPESFALWPVKGGTVFAFKHSRDMKHWIEKYNVQWMLSHEATNRLYELERGEADKARALRRDLFRFERMAPVAAMADARRRSRRRHYQSICP